MVDGELDDIRLGELEGRTLEDYRAWKHGRTRDEPFPGGESLNDAARRYADAYERVLQRDEETVLCVCHEIPVRYAINMAAGSNEFDGPLHDVRNATPYVFDADGLRRAVELPARPRALDRDAGELFDGRQAGSDLGKPVVPQRAHPCAIAARSMSSRGAFCAASVSSSSFIVISWKMPIRPR